MAEILYTIGLKHNPNFIIDAHMNENPSALRRAAQRILYRRIDLVLRSPNTAA